MLRKELTLVELLRSQAGVDSFLRVCTERNMCEYLLFWLESEVLCGPTCSNASLGLDFSRQLYLLFLASNAPLRLNVPSSDLRGVGSWPLTSPLSDVPALRELQKMCFCILNFVFKEFYLWNADDYGTKVLLCCRYFR